jgi:hypothetical protein
MKNKMKGIIDSGRNTLSAIQAKKQIKEGE